jgi:hypothetical protein
LVSSLATRIPNGGTGRDIDGRSRICCNAELDGRFEQVGFVPEDRLVGRAVRIWMNWRWPSQGGPEWSRIGKDIE